MAYFSSSPPISHPSLWNNHSRFNSYNSNNDSHDMPSSPFGTTAATGQASLGVAPPSNGQLSPTFGQAFQDAMNISSNSLPDPLEQQCPSSAIKPPKSSPHLMDISPAPSPQVQEKAIPSLPERRSSLQKGASSTTGTTKTFDSTFFERLAAHQSTHSSASVASTATSRSRARTSSSDGGRPLSDKDVNAVQSLSNVAAHPLPLKRPTGLLRTSSAAIAAKVNPFEVSPRPSLAAPHLIERAKSDNQLVFDLSKKTGLGGEGPRRPSGLSKETVSGARPSIVPYSLQSQGRKISGSSRVRSSLPQQWQDPQLRPPPLQHTHSAPMVKPADWGKFQALKFNNSDTTVVTRRSLGNDTGSRLARQLASPNGMEIDGESPARSQLLPTRRTSLACSPGLGNLFEEPGVHANASSPLGASAPGLSTTSQFLAAGNTRKRTIEDPDSSFNSVMDEGEEVLASDNDEEQEILALPGFSTESHSNPTSFSRAGGQRIIHRATSAASLNAASRKRGSGLSAGPIANTISGSSAEALGIGHPPSMRDKDSSRHRKMSRNADGRPILVSHRSSSSGSGSGLITYRRTHSMCDSEFYASPPLETADNNANPSKSGYFSTIHGKTKPQRPSLATTAHHHLSQQILPSAASRSQNSSNSAHLKPEDAFSPPRVMKNNPALQTYQPSPEQSQSFTSGFGCKEAEGKILPCHSVKEDGLMRITSDTLNDLLGGTYDEHIDKFIVIDCRFDYEYAGGHVEGAINLSTDALIENFFLSHGSDHPLYANESELPVPSKSGCADHTGNTKKTILIFHCEFSCKRAPTLAKHLRSKDRTLNAAYYPAVHYPELYVLDGGYAHCWKTHPERCDPQGYVMMDDPKHLQARTNDLHELRKKRLGIRAKSYTFGETLFSGKTSKAGSGNGQQPSKHMSTLNPAHPSSRPTSSSSSSSASSGPVPPNNPRHTSFNASLFSGVINTAQLCVHQEEQDDDMHVQGNSSGSAETEEGDTSFTGTKHAAVATGKHHHMMPSEDDNSSSPCGSTGGVAALVLGAGDSPCPSIKPSRPSFVKVASSSGGLFGQFTQRPGPRTLQRANTSQALPLGL